MSTMPQAPSMAPGSDVPDTVKLYRQKPQPVQSLDYRPGSLEITLFWNAPQDMRGVDKWRVFQTNETNLIQQIDSRDARQVTLKMPGNTKDYFYVCAVSNFNIEGPKVGVLASTDTNQMVTSGTTGATSGSSATPSQDWTQQGSGGGYRAGRAVL